MPGGFEAFVARRYLVTRKKTGFISIISLISILGITVGVAALIIVMSLLNGFSKELRTRLLGMDGHVWVSTPLTPGMIGWQETMQRIGTIHGVVGESPFCTFETAAHDRDRSSWASVQVRGIEPSTIGSVSDIRRYIRSNGSLDLSAGQDGVPGCVIGSYLAQRLGYTEVGEFVYMYGPTTNPGDMFDSMTMPPIYKFRVNGIFDSGYFDYDNSVVLIDIHQAQRILGWTDDDRVSGIALKLADMFAAPEYTREGGLIQQALGGSPYYSINWIDQNRVLFKWMKLEKWGAFIVLSLIVLVAAFNIVSSLIMLVMDKTREVGILKSMGATRRSIERIFVYQGTFIGVSGTILGSALGISLSWLQDTYQFISLPPDVYFISALPMDLQIRDALAITAVTMVLCWLSSFYPAKKAAELNPVDAIRTE